MFTPLLPSCVRSQKSPLLLVLLAGLLMAFAGDRASAGALFLDGNGSYVTFVGTGIPSGGSSFTIEAWINPSSIPAGGENGGQITFWGNQTGNQANGFRLRGSSGTRHFFWSNDHDANFGVDILPDTTGPSGDGWHHLAITYNGSQTVWYWNGNPIGTRQTAAGVNVQPANHRIGCRLNAEFFHGYIDEVRIWNTARSGAAIAADLGHSLGGNEPGLVAYFDFESDLTDRAGGDNNGTFLGNAAIHPTATPPIQTAAPRIFSFTATPSQVIIGTPATLAWQVTNATTLFIDQGVGPVTGATNSVQVTPWVPTTYTLTVSNEFGVRTALATISVDPGVPVAHPQSVATIKNTPLAITLTGSDPNGGTLTYSLVSLPQHGDLAGTPPQLTYTPANDYFGDDFFTFKVNDGTNDSPAAAVSIRIEATPTPPTAIVLSTTNINAGAGAGQFLSSLRAIDANPLDTHTFALVSGAGDTHNGLFAISGVVLLAGPAYEAQPGTNFSIRVRATDPTGLSVEQVVALSTIAVEQNVVINEINYNGPENTVRDEFVELYNPKATAVDLSFWRLRGGVDFVFPASTVIPAGGFLVVAQSPDVMLTHFGITALGPWDGQLASEGESLTLRAPDDQVIDEVTFRSEFPWPIAANGEGSSMELINPALDNDLGSSWAAPINPARPSPGQTNQVFAYNAAPNLRQVNHTPAQPRSTNTVTITAKVTDPEGVASVTLSYQVVLPGQFIPSTLPLTTAQLNSLNANPGLTNALNPAFEAVTNWITLAMRDDGLNGDAVAGDDIYSVVLPPQAHRTLVRYRITVADTFGATRRAPFADDPSLNFAYFVYDGIPAYQGYSPEVLQSLPVYWLIARDADINQCAAWFNSGDQLPQDVGGSRNNGRLYFNWEGAVVYDGVVYDHVTYRLRGANGRYHSGKRSFRIRFKEGHYLEAKDQFGQPFPKKWQELTTGKGQSNRGTESFALNEVVNYFLWNKVGVPAPFTFHFHFRVVRGVDETNRYQGDFWGLNWAQEEYDVAFLEAHDLPKGNVYKLVDNYVLGVGEQRYQAPFAVTNAADFYNIENTLSGFQTREWLEANANYDRWYRYHAIAEAIRHYDVWPSCNKNGAWYFEPVYTAANNYYGRMWLLPYDGTDTWGPTWNGGQDVLHNGIFNDSSVGGGDTGENAAMQNEYRNVVREIRDLLFQPDQINTIIDTFAARISAFAPADMARWLDAPAPASYRSLGIANCPGVTGGLPGYAQDMKNFMFAGGNNAWWIDRQSVTTPGGWVTRLDQLATDTAIPNKPVIRYAGLNGFPLNGLAFESSAFADPQGSNTFGAMQWRLAEVKDTNAPAADPRIMPKLEWDAVWESGVLTNFTARVSVPGAFVQPLKLYRARVRHMDNTGRWSRWSDPFIFYATPADILKDLQQSLVISELMFNPPNEGLINGDDLEYLELKNIGATALDLTGLSFTAGINFTFANGTVLEPGQTFLLVRTATAFASKYPGVAFQGTYTGRLDNAGETITISLAQGDEVLSVNYDDRAPWPVTPDGYGFSLVRDPVTGAYRASSQKGGSPGTDDPPVSTPTVLINELLANTGSPEMDRIELFNPSAHEVSVGGWFLGDDATVAQKYRIPEGTVIPAGGFLAFSEAQFNPNPGVFPSFALGSGGDDVYLFAADAAGNLTGYTHGLDFGASETGVSLGRYVTSDGRERIFAQVTNTFEAANAGPRVSPIVITEIMYHPPDLGTNDNSLDEFIEVFNRTAEAQPLFDATAMTNTWQLKGGVDFVLPANLYLAPGEFALLVNFDPADTVTASAFQTKYGVAPTVKLFGPYSGKLNNAKDDVELQKPVMLSATNVGYVLMDKVDYHDDAPWPKGADGLGLSLQRIDPAAFGDDPINWLAAPPSAAAARVTGGTAPTIESQPESLTTTIGQSAVFQVAATGTDPLQYRWLFNGTNLPGVTNANLAIAQAQPQYIGDYEVVVFNDYGSVLSERASLSVRVPAVILKQPASVSVRVKPDPLALAVTNATFSVEAYSANPISYQWRSNGVAIPGANEASLTITNVQTNHWAQYSVLVGDQQDAIESAAVWLNPLVRPGFAVGPIAQSVPPGTVVSLSCVATGWPPPFTFEWRTITYGFATNTQNSSASFLNLKMPNYPTNYNLRAIVKNPALPTGVASTFAMVSSSLLDTDGDGLPDTWENAYGFSTNNASDRDLDADGDGVSNYQEYASGSNPTNAQSYLQLDLAVQDGIPQVTFAAASYRTYSVEFREAVDRGQWYRLADVAAVASNRSVTLPDPNPFTPERFYRLTTPWWLDTHVGPVILQSPQPASVRVGDVAVFSVVATGTGPMSYEWFFNQAPIAGATASTLAVTNVTAADAGHYSVRLTDDRGSVTSDLVPLTVGPRLLVEPESQTVPAGSTVTFSVVAVGNEPLEYQWYHNAEVLPGQTRATLLLTGVSQAEAGAYAVRVRHQTPMGPATVLSRSAQLQVTSP